MIMLNIMSYIFQGDPGEDGNEGDYQYHSEIPDSKSCPVCSVSETILNTKMRNWWHFCPFFQEVFNDVTRFMTHIVKCKPPDEYESGKSLMTILCPFQRY
jgi:hypothetical protein